MQFTDDEIETLKEILSDWGSDCPNADYSKVYAIGVKLGMWEEEKPPTEEELQRRKEFQESLFGKQMVELFKRNNDYMANLVADEMKDRLFYQSDEKSNYQWLNEFEKGDAKIGSVLKIKMPPDWNK